MNAMNPLLDLPFEILRGILAGSGGQGVALASCCCKRLKYVADHLMQQPIFCSAMSTQQDLNGAIKDAACRAMTGSWGRIDFALIFVANYGLPKKYTDPGDASHAVDMLKEVLGKDIPIVGCACSGIMGTGPDSQPIEVDPTCRSQLGRRAARALLRQGQAQPPTRGVSVLLGKMPAGCAVRAFASATEPAEVGGRWPEFEDALALTSSQRTQLAMELAAAAHIRPASATTPVAAAVTAATATGAAVPAADGSASPATAAAATSLLSVAAGSSAAAVANGAFHSGYGDVRAELAPQLCLLLYHSGWHQSDELQAVVDWMAAHHPGMTVVGGASSGAGDLLYSSGAINRLAADPPPSPAYVGLLICSARSEAAQAATRSTAAAAAAGATASTSNRGSSRRRSACSDASKAMVDSTSLLSVAAMAVFGLEAVPGCAVYTDAGASLSRTDGDRYRLRVHAATQVTGTGNAETHLDAEGHYAGGSSSPATTATGTCDEEKQLRRSSSNTAVRVVTDEGDTEQHRQGFRAERRSERVQQLAAARASNLPGVQLLAKELLLASTSWDVERTFLGVWRCPTGTVPDRFSGREEQMVVLCVSNLGWMDDENDVLELEVTHVERTDDDYSQELLQHDVWRQQAGTRLCMQILHHSAQGSINMVNHGLARMKQQLQQFSNHASAAAPGAGSSTSGMAECYAAAAASAAAVGARSGLQGLAAFSCTGRGQALYSRYTDLSKASACDPNAYGAIGEAALVDHAFQQGMPFAGVFCDGELGPPVRCGCMGWAAASDEGSSGSMPHAYTSMFAAFASRAA